MPAGSSYFTTAWQGVLSGMNAHVVGCSILFEPI